MDSSSKIMENMVADSNKAVEFKLIRTVEDIHNDSIAFKPVMSHQIFGQQETIFGYSNLSIKLYFSSGFLNPYLEINYSEKVNPSKHESVEADNIREILTKELGIRFGENSDEFIRQLDNEVKFRPPGTLEDSFEVDADGLGRPRHFEVYFCEVTTPRLLQYHERLQTFILWFIDAASYIDVDDDKWKFFLLFEKVKSGGETLYAVAGYATLYEYYAYPKNIRPRLSQMLVLPPFQRQGLGAALLSAIYSHYQLVTNVTDITVEDPSEELQLVRDFVDCKNCSTLPSLQPPDIWTKGFTPDTVREASTKYKINKKQARRVYEILKLKTVKKEDSKQYQQYRIEVKRRLNLPNHNEQSKLKKLEKFMKPQEVAELKASFVLNDEQRISNLDKAYKELEGLYERVINRLNHL